MMRGEISEFKTGAQKVENKDTKGKVIVGNITQENIRAELSGWQRTHLQTCTRTLADINTYCVRTHEGPAT